MWLLRTDTDHLELRRFNDESNLPPYAILSHTWFEDGEEVTFNDIGVPNLATTKRKGWKKLDFARQQARRDLYDYVWVDTCCIDKASSAELSEAINSMYRWYKMAMACYVYLQDMPDPVDVEARYQMGGDANELIATDVEYLDPLAASKSDTRTGLLHRPLLASTDRLDSVSIIEDTGQVSLEETWSDIALDALNCGSQQALHARTPVYADFEAFKQCRWFTRGWTLQELVASRKVYFYNGSEKLIGALEDLASPLSKITGIHHELLCRKRPIHSFSIAQRMSWASRRVTTRVEDRAYSLLGIFDVGLTVMYGEGERAFQRLQEELIRRYSDQTIFTWGYRQSSTDLPCDLLAKSPEAFEYCHDIVAVRRGQSQHDHELTSKAVSFELPMQGPEPLSPELGAPMAVLNCAVEGQDTTFITMKLRELPSKDFVRTSIGTIDLYFATFHDLQLFNVLRSVDEAPHEDYSDRKNTFMCRSRPKKTPGPDLEIVEGNGSIVENPLFVDQTGSTVALLASDLWKQDFQSFVLPRTVPWEVRRDVLSTAALDKHRSVPYIFKGELALKISTRETIIRADMTIYPVYQPTSTKQIPAFTPDSLIYISFRSRSGDLTSRVTRLLGIPVASLSRGQTLTASIEKRQFSREEFTVVVFEVSRRTALSLFFRGLYSWLFSSLFDFSEHNFGSLRNSVWTLARPLVAVFPFLFFVMLPVGLVIMDWKLDSASDPEGVASRRKVLLGIGLGFGIPCSTFLMCWTIPYARTGQWY